MKLKLLVLLGLSVLVSGSAFGTSHPARSTGSYGQTPGIGPVSTLSGTNFQEVVVCQAGFTSDCTSSGPYDLLLSFTDDTQDGNSFTMNLATFTGATTTADDGGEMSVLDSYTFGVLSCGLQSAVVNNGTTFCTDLTNTALNTDATNCENGLASEFNSGGTFVGTVPVTIPGACVAKGLTLYFDETNADVSAPNFGGSTPTPEPGTFVLLGVGMFAVAGCARRRLPA